MDHALAVAALGALAQGTRLEIFRLLVRGGPEGLTPGALADTLGVAAPTLSFHLKELKGAGLVRVQREGRSLRYAPDFGAMRDLLGYLTDHCCQGVSTKDARRRKTRCVSSSL
jgi:DNA-binding transcriptional ArsR family regulator